MLPFIQMLLSFMYWPSPSSCCWIYPIGLHISLLSSIPWLWLEHLLHSIPSLFLMATTSPLLWLLHEILIHYYVLPIVFDINISIDLKVYSGIGFWIVHFLRKLPKLLLLVPARVVFVAQLGWGCMKSMLLSSLEVLVGLTNTVVTELRLNHDWVSGVLRSLKVILLQISVACAKVNAWRRGPTIEVVLMRIIASSTCGCGVPTSITCRRRTKILIILRDLHSLPKIYSSWCVIILIISSTSASIPLCLLSLSTSMAILTCMAQVTIATCRPQLCSLLPLIEFYCLIFHKANILELAEVYISKVFNQISHLSFVFFNFTNVYNLVHFKILKDYKN